MYTDLRKGNMWPIHGNEYNTATKRNQQGLFVSILVYLRNIWWRENEAYSKISIKWDDSFKIPPSILYIYMEGDT